jgi:hypothetical protein
MIGLESHRNSAFKNQRPFGGTIISIISGTCTYIINFVRSNFNNIDATLVKSLKRLSTPYLITVDSGNLEPVTHYL